MRNQWQHYKFELGSHLNCAGAVKFAIESFVKEILGNEIGENTILFMFKIKSDKGYRSITHMQTFHFSVKPIEYTPSTFEEPDIETQKNIKTLEDLLLLCEESWDMVSDRYQQYLINSIIFMYKIIPTAVVKEITNTPAEVVLENKFVRKEEALEVKPEPLIYKGHNLPTTMDFTKWGECEIDLDYKTAIVKKLTKNGKETKTEYHITINDLTLNVDLKIGNFTAFSWEDNLNISNNEVSSEEDKPKISSSLQTFKRTIKNNTYYFEEGELVLNTIKKSCNKITTVSKSSYRSKNFITYDIETKTIDGIMVPYCVCLYDGQNHKVFYITDYDNLNLSVEAKSNIMLKDSINFLLKPKYSGYKVYAHNFSYFDGIFLMKIITEIDGVVKPIIREGKFIETKMYYGWKKPLTTDGSLAGRETNIFKDINAKVKNCKFSISFRDSLLLLPAKLSLLAKTFGVESKDIFPYNFVNKNEIGFLYKGPQPALQYFNVDDMGDTTEERLQTWKAYRARFSNQSWDLKNETIDYCKNDVKILWEIINQYSKIVFENWFVDVIKSPTISSLAFKIYRSNYLGELEKGIQIPIITGKTYEDIRKSYTGGAVDVYKPYGENIKVYDVKSLYPAVMLNNPVPVGNPTYFEGDILNKNYFQNNPSGQNKKPFGFFYVNITAPKGLNEPILQLKKKINGLYKTIAPLGVWKGWYFSEELYNAEKYGYKFEIIKGYTFDKSFIFKDYVEKLYQIKESHPKGSPMNLNAKLLLNSLYGRFGMSPINEEHIILPSHLTDKFILDDKYEIIDIIDFRNNQILISYIIKQNPNEDSKSNLTQFKNVSIAVAAAITAYGRIHMSQFKNNKDLGEILYTDTDCIAITGEMNKKFIGKGLGQMELEKSFYKVVYLAPKVYIGLIPDKKEINKQKILAVIKGINVKKLAKNFKFDDFLLLLQKGNSFEMKNLKWSRNLSNAAVSIDETNYNLIVTGSKRTIIYKNNIFTDTEPLILNE